MRYKVFCAHGFGPWLLNPWETAHWPPLWNTALKHMKQPSPHGYNLPNNELEVKFSVDLEMSFWSITLGQGLQMPFFLYISCTQCHWDTQTSPEPLGSNCHTKVCLYLSWTVGISHRDDFWQKQWNPALPPFTHMPCSLHFTDSWLIPPTLRIGIAPTAKQLYTTLEAQTCPREWESFFQPVSWKKETERWEDQAGCRKASSPWAVG